MSAKKRRHGAIPKQQASRPTIEGSTAGGRNHDGKRGERNMCFCETNRIGIFVKRGLNHYTTKECGLLHRNSNPVRFSKMRLLRMLQNGDARSFLLGRGGLV